VAKTKALAGFSGPSSLRESAQCVSILVADETRMGCQLLASAFNQSSFHIKVAALAVDSAEVLRAVKELQPDVVVMRASLRDGPQMGLKAARDLRASGSLTKVILLIDTASGVGAVEAFRAGVQGVIGRDEPFEALCKSVSVIQKGQVWVNSDQLRGVIDYLYKSSCTPAVSPRSSNGLTKREEEVVKLVSEGMTNREVSLHLNLSANTVRNYLFRIFNKTGTSTRLELALYESNRKQSQAIPALHNFKIQ